MARFSGAAFRLVERRMTAFLVAAGVCLTLLLPGDVLWINDEPALILLAIGNVVLGPLFGWLLDHLARNYRYTFLFGAALTALSVISLWKVFRGYLACGGDAAYTPPDPGE